MFYRSCPSVCRYCVTFSNGRVMYPSLPGSADVYAVAEQYARETLTKENDGIPVTVVSIVPVR